MTRHLEYGVGALRTITISIGIAVIVYGGGYIPFNLLNLPAWVFGPLGVYTLISLLYYRSKVFSVPSLDLGWNLGLLTITVISTLYNTVNIIVAIGVLFITFGVLASFASLRNLKKEDKHNSTQSLR